MKKKNVINLIRYHAEKNEAAFREEVYEIAKYFDSIKDYELSEYIMSLMSNANVFSPQMIEDDFKYLKKVEIGNESIPLPDALKDSVLGIINAIGHRAGVNKFLFEGPPGTGKTETAKQIARILERELYVVDFDLIIDSKLGQTSKNISALFSELQRIPSPDNVIILFDEIDAIAIDRINSNDIREMGRVTSSILKELDNERMLNKFLNKFKFAGRNMRLFKKILSFSTELPYPGELKNLIKTSLAFSDPNSEFDYLKRIYTSLNKNIDCNDLKSIQDKGFTVREIELLTGVSKSQVSRKIRGL